MRDSSNRGPRADATNALNKMMFRGLYVIIFPQIKVLYHVVNICVGMSVGRCTIVSSPIKLGEDFLFLKFGQKEGVMKKLLRNRGVI